MTQLYTVPVPWRSLHTCDREAVSPSWRCRSEPPRAVESGSPVDIVTRLNISSRHRSRSEQPHTQWSTHRRKTSGVVKIQFSCTLIASIL